MFSSEVLFKQKLFAIDKWNKNVLQVINLLKELGITKFGIKF